MLELVRHVHRDVTVGGHEEARQLARGPQGHELAPGRLQVQDESQGRDHVPGRLQVTVTSGMTPKGPIHRQEAVAVVTADFAPTVTLVLVVPSLLPQGAVILVRGLHPRISRRSPRARPGGHPRTQTGG